MSFEIEIKVKPNSKQQKIEKITDTSFEVCVKSKPERGKANKEVLVLLSKILGVPKTHIQLVRGSSGRMKQFDIPDGIIKKPAK